jgi:glycosyltransferase involved in cell wall biosynthesis
MRQDAKSSKAEAQARLKILFLTNRSPYPIKDGQSRRTYNILKGLARRHEVHLLSLYESPAEIEPECVKRLESFCARVEMLPAPPKTFSVAMAARLLSSLFSFEPYTIWRHYSPAYAKRLRAWLDATTFDIIHCDILPLAYCVRNLNGAFCVLTDHDVSYLKARRLAAQSRNPAVKLFLYYEALKLKRLERRIFKHVNLGIAVSEVDRRHLQSLCPEGRFAVVENGVDVTTFVPKPEAAEPDTLLWIGGFHDYFNYEAILFFLDEIYPRIKKEKTDAKLYLVGGEVPDRLRKFAARDPSIVFTGYVEDPLPYLQRASVFIAPILSGGGTKLKVLEAMSTGKAVISTSIGVEGIEGENGRHFIVADHPDSFSAGVVDLLNDRARRDFLGSNARRLIEEKYDWAAICEKTSKIYLDAREGIYGRE